MVSPGIGWRATPAACLGDRHGWVGDPAFYGDRWADVYDEHHGWFDPAAAVEFLAGPAGAWPVLELAIGTGLLTQARQAECFHNVARVLGPAGVFVIECFVPDLARFDRSQRVRAVYQRD